MHNHKLMRVVLGLALLGNVAVVGAFQPTTLSQDALDLAFELDTNVQPIQVTFQVLDSNSFEPIEVTLTRTATAVFSDSEATYWLTVPSALRYADSAVLGPSFIGLKVGGSDARVDVLEVVDNFRGFYAILKEFQPRSLRAVTLGVMLPPFHNNRVGMIYASTESGLPQRVVMPVFQPVQSIIDLPGRDVGGFTFDVPVIVQSSALGAPVFHRQTDAISGESVFEMVGMVIGSELQRIPTFTQRAINAPHASKVFDAIFAAQ